MVVLCLVLCLGLFSVLAHWLCYEYDLLLLIVLDVLVFVIAWLLNVGYCRLRLILLRVAVSCVVYFVRLFSWVCRYCDLVVCHCYGCCCWFGVWLWF